MAANLLPYPTLHTAVTKLLHSSVPPLFTTNRFLPTTVSSYNSTKYLLLFLLDTLKNVCNYPPNTRSTTNNGNSLRHSGTHCTYFGRSISIQAATHSN